MPEDSATDLVTRAHDARVVVVGGGIAGLVAALECAKIGMAVTVLEASDRWGGSIETVDLDGLRVDLIADSFRLGSPALTGLIDELGLADRVEPARTDAVWIATGTPAALRVAPLPAGSLLGIPGNPWADDVRGIIGWGGAWRAYLDRLRPPLTIGRQSSLGALVRTRMGARVRDRLVAPLAVGVFGVDPDLIDVDAAAPGLSAALTRTGSLAGAVAQQLPEDAAAARATIAGGLSLLVDALVQRLRDLDAELLLNAPVTGASREGAEWIVRADAADAADAAEGVDDADAIEPASTTEFTTERITEWIADTVIVATEAAAASALFAGVDVRVEPAAAPIRDVVTLVVDCPALDVSPRGAAVYSAPGAATATGVVHATAVWPALAEDAGAGRHVVRVSLPATDARDEAATIALAQSEAAALLGVPLDSARAAACRRVALSAPASVIGHRDGADRARRALATEPGLVAVGAWLSGSGLAAVVADAVDEVEKVRQAVLWGER